MADQSDYIKTALRLPRNMHAAVQRAAEESGRSLNAEIITRLQESFISPATRQDTEGLINKMLERLVPALADIIEKQNALDIADESLTLDQVQAHVERGGRIVDSRPVIDLMQQARPRGK